MSVTRSGFKANGQLTRVQIGFSNTRRVSIVQQHWLFPVSTYQVRRAGRGLESMTEISVTYNDGLRLVAELTQFAPSSMT